MEGGGVSKHFLVLRPSPSLTTSSSFLFLFVSFDLLPCLKPPHNTPRYPLVFLANLCFRNDPREFLISCGLRFIHFSCSSYNFQRSSEVKGNRLGLWSSLPSDPMNSTMNSTADGYCLSEEMMKLSHHTFESLVIGKVRQPFFFIPIILRTVFDRGKWNEFIVNNSLRPRMGNTSNTRAKAPYYSVKPLYSVR